MSGKKLSFKPWHLTAIIFIIYDMLCVGISYFLALWLRFDCNYSEIPEFYIDTLNKFVIIHTAVCIVVFCIFKIYRNVWEYISYNEIFRILVACGITSVLHIVETLVYIQSSPSVTYNRMPIPYYMFGLAIQFCLMLAARFIYRYFLREKKKGSSKFKSAKGSNIMIYGAGEAGILIMNNIKETNALNDKVCCIIDDDPNKHLRLIDGIPIVGGRDKVEWAAKKYNIDKIYVTIPSASPSVIKDILNICAATGCQIKNLPDIRQLINSKIVVSALKNVEVEDLLGRDTIIVNTDEIFDELHGKTILVTGGGGSIGSELCRQIAAHAPKRLVIFDIYENSTYEIERELRKKFPSLDLVTLIGSVRDSRKIDDVFNKYSPQIVYHAAAHKHVPLMETSPCEAIKNNVIGTYKTAYAAMVNGCRKFVLISTDKAVNPTNIMGASKRICEMVIQTFDRLIKTGNFDKLPLLASHIDGSESFTLDKDKLKDTAKTDFAAVRFGNVLGSNGSVIPIFKKQIASGGPVTVTHPEIVRYFMTIPEAVSLVLQAGAYATGGEIYVLDMGEPVKIDTLARNLISLSGYRPDIDIKVEYTGLRPGEKLYEEKLLAEEGLRKSENNLIHICKPLDFDTDEFIEKMSNLMELCYDNNPDIRTYVKSVVKNYNPDSQG